MNTPEIISVSQYLDKLNITLKGEQAKIVGEVSGLKLHQNGHYYFSLLDKKDGSKIDCVIWRSNYKVFNVELADGLEIIVFVTPNVYKLNGRLSFIVNSVELVGEGALQIAYEKLKKKLDTEGLFSESKKRKIPNFPNKIGVITSKSGAVIHDFNTNLGKFGYKILFMDSKVEGADAIKELLFALETLKKKDINVLVIMRGGGSLESFQAFNNEVLVRAVATFPVPVITGIGHDKDVPLVSLASDKNVSTPTAVANLLNQSWKEALSLVQLGEEKIFSRFESTLSRYKTEEVKASILREFSVLLERTKDLLKQRAQFLKLSSPERMLKMGFSIVKKGGRVVKYVKDVKLGDNVEVLLSDGTINTKVI